MIEVEALQKAFGAVRAVDGLSFTAEDAKVTGLLGPNGAGKTTTLRMLYGLIRPDGGRVRVGGIDLAKEPRRAQAQMGVLPDAQGLYPRLTAREHILYFGRLHGLGGAALRRRTDELIETLGMEKIASRRASGFSQGERMKVALARALVHDPQHVLLDEPTNGLDVMSTRAMREHIRGLRSRGRCVLFSSHIMQEVSALCDVIVIVSRGRVEAVGSPDAIREQAGCEDLEEAFVRLAGVEAGEGAELRSEAAS